MISFNCCKRKELFDIASKEVGLAMAFPQPESGVSRKFVLQVPDFPVIRYRSEPFWQHFFHAELYSCTSTQVPEPFQKTPSLCRTRGRLPGTRVCNEWLRGALPFTASAARMAQRVVLLAQKREDQKLMAFLREQARSSAYLNRAPLHVPAEPQAIGSKPIKKLAQAQSQSMLCDAWSSGIECGAPE